MATQLSKPVWRVVSTPRGLMNVALANGGVLIRRYGARKTHGPVPFTAIEDLAVKIEVTAQGITVPTQRRQARAGSR